jgi:hypothetical protein
MSNEVKAPVIVRNGVPFTFTKGTTSKKHSNPGMDFWYPYVTFEQIDESADVRKWFGDVLEAVNKPLRIIFTDLAIDHTVDGVLNYEQWEAAAADFTAGRAKIADLDEEISSWNDINVKLGDELIKLTEDGVDSSNERVQQLYKEIATNTQKHIKPLKILKAQISEKYAKIVEARKAKEVAA